jgi:hypothetical protein
MADKQLGIRFIRHWDVTTDVKPGHFTDQAFVLAWRDERDVPFAEKLADAYTFLKNRIN